MHSALLATLTVTNSRVWTNFTNTKPNKFVSFVYSCHSWSLRT